MTAIPYARRALTVTFQIEGETLTLRNLRVQARITNAVLASPGEMELQVWGMTLSQMNKLSVAGLQYLGRVNKNQVKVDAGTVDGQQVTTVFNGGIVEAYPDFQHQPDAPFQVLASVGPGIALPPVKPVSFNDAVPVETILKQVLAPSGYKLENNGVTTVLRYPYLKGTMMEQLRTVCQAADCYGTIDGPAGTVAIWPKDGAREGDAVVISKDTGMIGYPSFENMKIRLRTLFDPAIRGVGTKIQVKSQLTAANGVWSLTQVDMNLSSEMPKGPWELALQAFPIKGAAQAGQPWQDSIAIEPET